MTTSCHPHDPHISNGSLARLLIFLSGKRWPGIFRLYSAYLNCDLGRPLPPTTFLPHPFGIILSAGAELGEHVVVGQQVTIGNKNGVLAAPKIGNRVYIAAGAKVLGDISIGDDSIIGANAVVTKSVPPNVVVVGANKIIDKKSNYWNPHSPLS
jgi:serine O-acetyltransferase